MVHAMYWIVTHPVNSAWLKDIDLAAAEPILLRSFFAEGADRRHMRNVEWSHVARASFRVTLGLLSMTMAITR